MPKSNMVDAIRGETFDITLTKGYFTEAKEEARAVGRAAIIPKELECFEQARKVMRLIRNRKVVPSSVDLPRGGYSRMAVDPAQMERLWDAWTTAVLADVMLPIYPSIVLSEMGRSSDKMVILLRCLAASGTGAAVRIAAAMSAGYGPPVYKEEIADATVFYLLDQTFNTASQKNKKGMDPATLAENILACRTKDSLRGSPDNRPFKNYEVHYVTSTRDNEETSLRMMMDRAYELLDKRTEECVQKHGNANAAKSDLCLFGFRGSYLYRWEKNARSARSDAAAVWSKDVESLVEVPAEGKGKAPDREAEVPQAAAAASQPSVESPAAKRAASLDREERRAKDPVDTQKKDETTGPTGPGMPISYAPKYTDDDGDLRDTAARRELQPRSLEGACTIM